jgi:hypothetical protein
MRRGAPITAETQVLRKIPNLTVEARRSAEAAQRKHPLRVSAISAVVRKSMLSDSRDFWLQTGML